MAQSKRIDLSGQVIGKWTVQKNSVFRNRILYWHCQCECGTHRLVNARSLIRNISKSCGGCNIESNAETKSTRSSWDAMMTRCYKQSHVAYELYGGRGIEVCEKWQTFNGFLDDMGIRPHGMTLDRIDNNGNYEPSNCRWATYTEQGNNRRNNRIVEYQGNNYTIAELSRKLGINYTTLKRRVEHGRPLDAPVQ